jgi:hypothetical protein
MGAWGTAIFSDDTAVDVRDEFRDLVGQGLSGEQATEKLLVQWKESLRDPDEAPVFWLALAATQWKLGRLSEHVREMALRTITDGSDLSRWSHDLKSAAARKRHLEKLQLTLNSPQPDPRPVHPRFKNTCDWVPGEVVAYRMKSGMMVLFRAIGVHSDAGGDSPVCEVLDWYGAEVPSADFVLHLAVREQAYQIKGSHDQLMIGATSAREFPRDRVFRTGIMSKPSQQPGRFAVTLWRGLDKVLSQYYGFL